LAAGTPDRHELRASNSIKSTPYEIFMLLVSGLSIANDVRS
jgi:hypothetical protein